jgi:hypothetical protein
MREWPLVLRDRYPLPPNVLPERPWWNVQEWIDDVSDRGFRLLGHRRRHDAVVVVRPGLNIGWPLAQLAEYDAEHPLPHPGVRVGQVWAMVEDDGFVRAWQLVAQNGERFAAFVGDSEESSLRSFIVGHRFDWIEESDLAGAFLVADPCCPWAAPWGPPE